MPAFVTSDVITVSDGWPSFLSYYRVSQDGTVPVPSTDTEYDLKTPQVEGLVLKSNFMTNGVAAGVI